MTAALAWLDAPLDEPPAASQRPHPSRGVAPSTSGLDELEELLDAAIYRRERYRAWYGRDASMWPAVAFERWQHARAEIEALRAELRLGPLSKREPRSGEVAA